MGRKKLPECSRGHDVSVVGRFNGKRDGYGPCKACNLINARESRERRIAFLQSYKTERGCIKCGYDRCAQALDFHHRDPKEKSFTVSQRPFAQLDLVLAEIAKCDVICRNCHAEEHAQ